MKLTAPTKIVFIISVCLLIVGIIANYVPSFPDVLNNNAVLVTFAGGALLSLGVLLKGF
ncbi:MAG: hypothetical protein FWC19_09155 [Treponema sp.]|jgi:hypothetical protein|nr:hypothetical protein [Treponema sp.]MCL2272950.1 hypothetical protein [Treponema sp.]